MGLNLLRLIDDHREDQRLSSLALRAADEGGFQPPTINDTHLPDIIPWGAEWGTFFGKAMLVLILSVIFIVWFFNTAIRRKSLVPTRTQFIAESIYGFVRHTISRDVLGEKHFKPWIPFLFAVFVFVLVNNLTGAIPLIQMPTFSHAGVAYAMAAIMYVTWIGVGLQKHGPKFFWLSVAPSGVPKPILLLLVPLEIISNYIVRPLTHSLRIMAVMLAGHMIMLVAAVGAEYMISQGGLLTIGGVAAIVGAIPMYFIEILLMVIQALVFTLLTAVYIQQAIEVDAH